MPTTVTQPIPNIRVPQARVLNALLPNNPSLPISEWPILTRKLLNVAVGYSPISTGVTRPLYGIPENSTSGHPHPGLLALGLVEVVKVNIQGVIEDNYRITKLGIQALAKFFVEGGKLPTKKDRATNTNKRYMESVTSHEASSGGAQ